MFAKPVMIKWKKLDICIIKLKANNMQKIIYTISTLKRSGPVLVLYNIIKNLDKNAFEPVIITLTD